MANYRGYSAGDFLAEGESDNVDGWCNMKDIMNDLILCPRCKTVVTYDKFTMDILGVCCANCCGRDDL